MPLHCFLPQLWLLEVGDLTVLLSEENISLQEGVVVLSENISLWEGVVVLKSELFLTGFSVFLVTDATCLLHLEALLVQRTLTRPSHIAVAWLIRILASSLSTT